MQHAFLFVVYLSNVLNNVTPGTEGDGWVSRSDGRCLMSEVWCHINLSTDPSREIENWQPKSAPSQLLGSNHSAPHCFITLWFLSRYSMVYDVLTYGLRCISLWFTMYKSVVY